MEMENEYYSSSKHIAIIMAVRVSGDIKYF